MRTPRELADAAAVMETQEQNYASTLVEQIACPGGTPLELRIYAHSKHNVPRAQQSNWWVVTCVLGASDTARGAMLVRHVCYSTGAVQRRCRELIKKYGGDGALARVMLKRLPSTPPMPRHARPEMRTCRSCEGEGVLDCDPQDPRRISWHVRRCDYCGGKGRVMVKP